MSEKAGGIDKVSVLQKQLAISLKFHHSDTLQRLPLESAVQVMVSVWQSCHAEASSEDPHNAVTAVIPREQVLQSIRQVESST